MCRAHSRKVVVRAEEPPALRQAEDPAVLLQAEGVLAALRQAEGAPAVALQAAGAGPAPARWEAVLALEAPAPAKADRPVHPLVVPETEAMQVPRPVKIHRPAAQIVRQFVAGLLTKEDGAIAGPPLQ